MNDVCFNCGRPDATHIAMYCDAEPQKFLRCSDHNCWAAARNQSEHKRGCANRNECTPLSVNDKLHCQAMRIRISSEKEPIKRLIPGTTEPVDGFAGIRTRSSIANDIEFEWTDEKTFELYGPETMNFRILLVINNAYVARFDVGQKKVEMTLFDSPMPLERYIDATKPNQTAAILVTKENERIDIETNNQVSHCVFKKVGSIYVLADYEFIQK